MTDQAITQWTAATILETLHQNRQKLYDLGARKLGLFGSYVRGEQTPDSDMDFLVVLAEHDFSSYVNIKYFLQDLFHCNIDLAEEGGLKERLRPYIMSEVIYVEGLQNLSPRYA